MERKALLKKVLSVFTAGALSLSLMPGVQFGGLSIGVTASAASNPDNLVFDVSEGSISIGANSISYGNNQSQRYDTGDVITITGETSSNTVTVDSGVSANITLAGVTISGGGAAFKIADNSTGNVTITLADGTTNTLKSGNYRAGLQKNGGFISADQGKLTIRAASLAQVF